MSKRGGGCRRYRVIIDMVVECLGGKSEAIFLVSTLGPPPLFQATHGAERRERCIIKSNLQRSLSYTSEGGGVYRELQFLIRGNLIRNAISVFPTAVVDILKQLHLFRF